MEIKSVTNVMNRGLTEGESSTEATHSKSMQQQNSADLAQKELQAQLEKLDAKQLEDIFDDFKQKFDYLNQHLKIEIDEELNRPIVKIVDKETKEVVRELPPEQLVQLAKKIDQMVGLLFDKEV